MCPKNKFPSIPLFLIEDKHQTTTGAVVEAGDHGSSQLPPEPEGMCNPALQKHITEMWNRRRETGYDMNAVIQNKKMFRNPSIYEKLIQACVFFKFTPSTGGCKPGGFLAIFSAMLVNEK